MDCRTVHDQLSMYLDQDLPLQTRTLLDQHFTACPPCRTALTQLRTVTAWVGELPLIQPSSAFLQQVRARVAHLPQPSQMGFFRRLAGTTPLQAAAALVLVVSAALIWQMAPYGWEESGQEVDPPSTMLHEQSLPPGLDAFPFEPILDDPPPALAPLVQMPPRQPWLTVREEFVRFGRDVPSWPMVASIPGETRGEVSLFPSLTLRADDPVQTAQQIWELVPGVGGALLQSQGMITPAGRTSRGPVRLTLSITANRYQNLLDAIRQIPGTIVAEERMAVIGREVPPGGMASLWRVEHSPAAAPAITVIITVFPH